MKTSKPHLDCPKTESVVKIKTVRLPNLLIEDRGGDNERLEPRVANLRLVMDAAIASGQGDFTVPPKSTRNPGRSCAALDRADR